MWTMLSCVRFGECILAFPCSFPLDVALLRGVLILSGLVLFGVRIVLVFELGKFGSHRWVAARESLDRQVFGLIVGKP